MVVTQPPVASGHRGDDPVITRARELTTGALHAAMREDWPAASQAMQALASETGSTGVTWALLRFCDTILGAQQRMRGLPDGTWEGGAAVKWFNTEDGTVGHAGQVPDSVRWAGQLVAAKAARDEGMFRALLGAMPGDDAGRGRYVGALLQSCAITANMARKQAAS